MAELRGWQARLDESNIPPSRRPISALTLKCQLSFALVAWDLSVIIPLVVSVLTAVGFSSLIAQWAGGAKERRAARASALAALRTVEEYRWFGDDSDAGTFKTSVRDLETAMLLARVPAAPVAVYVALASASYQISRLMYERHGGDDEGGGTLPRVFSDYVRRAARILLRYIWSPRGLHRLPDRIKLRYIKWRVKRLDGDDGRIVLNELGRVGASR